jgi:hypothetical protein
VQSILPGITETTSASGRFPAFVISSACGAGRRCGWITTGTGDVVLGGRSGLTDPSIGPARASIAKAD